MVRFGSQSSRAFLIEDMRCVANTVAIRPCIRVVISAAISVAISATISVAMVSRAANSMFFD